MYLLIFWMLLCGILSLITGGSFMEGLLSPLILLGVIALAIWLIRRQFTKAHTRYTSLPKQTQETAPPTQCRKCGHMTPPDMIYRGTASYVKIGVYIRILADAPLG